MTRNFDDEKRDPPEIIIQDLRHARSADDLEEEEEQTDPEAAAATESTPLDPVPMEVIEAPGGEPAPVGVESEFEAPQPDVPHVHNHADDLEQVHDHDHGNGDVEPQMSEAEEAEFRQILQIFELGLETYMKSQLGIFIQFALIHMGRMAHPITNLVATDLPKARFAIDLLHVCFSDLESGLQPQEKMEFQNVLAQLQMTYAQLAGNSPTPPLPEEPQA